MSDHKNNNNDDNEIVIPGYGQNNGVLIKVNRVLRNHNSVKITIKREVASLARISAGDTLIQYYDPKLKAIIMKKLVD